MMTFIEKKYVALFLLSLSLLFGMISKAQTPTDKQRFLPVLVPPTPEAAAFTKYGNYNVNLFTGIPNISIPIFEIKVGELSVPISLNYHPSGIRVSEIPSRMGTGWDLQAGGSITRKIVGRADEMSGNYLTCNATSAGRVRTSLNLNVVDDMVYLYNVDKGLFDTEPDLFSYNIPGHTGKFVFDQHNNFNAILIPFAPIQVSESIPTQSNLSLGIVDEKGIAYKFNAAEWTLSGGGITTYAPSAWLLTDMISANKQDTISLKYLTRTGGGNTDSYFSDYFVVNDQEVTPASGDAGTSYSDPGSTSTVWQQLTEISFKNGKIVFEAAPETRLDFSSVYKMQNRLSAIKIYNFDAVYGTYTMIRNIQFFHSYFISGTDAATKRLRLDSIQINTAGGTVAQTYRFSYNTTVSLPNNTSRMKDFWGYFNNKNNVRIADGYATSIPKMTIPWNSTTLDIGGNMVDARDPDPNYMQAAILQKITYPTGGFTAFEYETNQYLDAQSNPKYAGGLRIKSIKSYTDPTATPIVKIYKYGSGESGYGRNNFILENYFFNSTQTLRVGNCGGSNGFGTLRVRTFFANPTNDLEGYDGSPVVYPVVTEYLGDATVNAGKTIYTFSDKADTRTDLIGLGKPYFDSYHFMRGLMLNKSDYRKNPDNSYSIVAETRNTYQYFPNQFSTGGIGFAAFKKVISTYGGDWFCSSISCFLGCGPATDQNSYNYNNYEIITGDNKLVSNTKITYDQNDPLKFNSVTTNYTYDDIIHNNVTQTQTTNSKNESITTNSTYPYNYSTAPYTSMTTNHIFDKVIQKTEKNSGNILSVQSNNFTAFSGNNYLTSSIQLQVKSFAAETRASFNQYDMRSNILEMQKANDVKLAFIWDYQTLSLIAQVTNAAQSDIAYTSFESDGKGNWIFSGWPLLDATAPTGNRCLQMIGNVTKSGLSSTSSYVVSYWKKSGSITINGTSGLTGKSSNGWTYYEHTVTNPAAGTITVTGTGAVIDELRLYPVNAQMITKTYTPLIGVTSECDVNNRITYYEYDGAGRLIVIRDMDRSIVKKICYNYAGQTENCNLYYNISKSGTFTTSCAANNIASSVTYTVPANMYVGSSQAEADQLAQNDVNLNGQIYANKTGTCTPSINIQWYNVKTSTYNIRFTNTSTGIQYNYTLSSNHPAIANLADIPKGTYTVLFYPQGAAINCTFGIAGLSYYGTGATFNNVALTGNSATASINN